MVGNGENKKVSHPRAAAPAFGDIVGQQRLKESLLAVAANDALDGLLIRGEKGTAKSTAVRGLVDLLPTQVAVADCPYGCPPDGPAQQCPDCRERADPPTERRPVPLVTLPLGASRERVLGSLSVADALDGDYEFDPGLLARANRGILYVDEVNLLDDHLVDVLLDAAASGVNRVERDGVSVSHPSSFTLVGTMNPEEGDLRPQLRDRFALQTTVTGCADLDRRVAIVEQALGRADACGGDATDEYRERLSWARVHLDEVTVPSPLLEDIAELCRDADVDGHRGDIATARAARTLAALKRRTTVREADVRRAAELALPHRLQSRPFEETPDESDLLDDHFDADDADEGGEDEADPDPDDQSADTETADGEGDGAGGDGGDDTSDSGDEEGGSGHAEEPGRDGKTGDGSTPRPQESGADDGRDDADPGESDRREEGSPAARDDDATGPERTPLVPGQSWEDVGEGSAPPVSTPEARTDSADAGSRSVARPSADGEGPRVRTEPADATGQVDVAASVRAAGQRGGAGLEERDLRQSVRASDAATLVVFAVDASASMRSAMRAAKGTVLELLKDAYQQRDEVAFVAFAGEGAEVLVPPTDSVSLAARHLKELPTGDRTPLPAGLLAARDVIERADPAASVVVVVTDGRANAADSPVRETRDAAGALGETGAHVVVVDTDTDDRTGLTDVVVEGTDAEHIALSALSAGRIDDAAGATRANTR